MQLGVMVTPAMRDRCDAQPGGRAVFVRRVLARALGMAGAPGVSKARRVVSGRRKVNRY